MPAEWHPHSATWLSWPKDPVTWPDRVPQVQEIFQQIIRALAPRETIHLLVDNDEVEQEIRRRLGTGPAVNSVVFHQIVTVDSWIRDYGPNFILAGDRLAYNDWEFNAWGNKYEDLKRDNSVPSRLEPWLKLPRFEPAMVLEGGSIEVNGDGVCMTTEQCLLHPNRNPGFRRDEIEQRLKDYLGATSILWLGDGIVGDDTDGHIDDLARFVSPSTIVCALEDDPSDENYRLLQDNYDRLRTAVDTQGKPFEIVTLPMPGFVGSPEGRLPASYANFYIANGVVLLPVFGHANDRRAIEVLQKLFSDRTVIPIQCEPLAWGMGTIHCVTQQQPAVEPRTS